MTPSDAAAYARLSAELRGEVGDEADQASRLQQLEVEARLMEQARRAAPGPQLFAEDAKTVLCWECQAPIPPERLAVLPDAAFCVGCLEIIERQQRREAL